MSGLRFDPNQDRIRTPLRRLQCGGKLEGVMRSAARDMRSIGWTTGTTTPRKPTRASHRQPRRGFRKRNKAWLRAGRQRLDCPKEPGVNGFVINRAAALQQNFG